MIKEIFYEVLNEAVNGEVIIDGDPIGISFNSVFYQDGIKKELFSDRNNATLVLKNDDEFFELLDEYLMLEINANRRTMKFIGKDTYRYKVKLLITYLFANASTEEFLNPNDMLRRKIAFLEDDSFSYLDDGKIVEVGNAIDGADICLKRSLHSVFMETSYKLEMSFIKNEIDEKLMVPFADISYRVIQEGTEKVCYIYSVMKPKVKDLSPLEEKLNKKINRTLYKLNEGILEQESEEFKAYKRGEDDYYPSNISDVTQSFVLASTSFISLLQKEGITKVKIVPYLPVRYAGRDNAAGMIKNEDRRRELIERNNRIQANATDKFMRVFRRVQYHMNNDMVLKSVPYEYDEFMTFIIKEKSGELNNPILEEISRGVLSIDSQKKL